MELEMDPPQLSNYSKNGERNNSGAPRETIGKIF